MRTFLGMCLRGEAKPEDIDRHVASYFNSDIRYFDCLRDFLGVTTNDYYEWAYKGADFAQIVEAQRKITIPV